MHRCPTKCSDKVEDDSIFKETLVEYKASLLKSGYPEENINKKFIDFAIKKKRSKILKNEDRKKRKRSINKYCFVMDYVPSFPDIKKAFKIFGHILENDEEIKVVFPYGVKHFQISKKEAQKNIKEILEQ